MSKLPGTPLTRARCGEQRCANVYRILEALAKRGLTCADVARRLGVTRGMVSHVINGKTHSARILDALREAGVPEKYLFDPRKEKEVA